MAVILVLLESYCIWVERFNNSGNDHKLFELEKAFYFCSLEVILSNFLLFSLMGILGATTGCFKQDESGTNKAINLLRALILASIGNFFFLPIMWKESSTATQVAIHLTLVILYFITSLVRGHSVVSHTTQKSSLVIVIVSFILMIFILNETDPYLKSLFF